jgi:hypothetical protein
MADGTTLIEVEENGKKMGTATIFLSLSPFNVAPQRGLEPRTRWLTATCSTD